MAELYFENKEYQKALDMIARCKIDSIEDRQNTKRGKIYLLSALCNLSLFYENQSGQSIDEEQVRSIYSEFSASRFDDSSDSSNSHKNLLPLMKIINLQTNVHNDYDDDEANVR